MTELASPWVARWLPVAPAGNRGYDGTTAASVNLLDNRVAGDSLVLSLAGASFADKNAGSGKVVTVDGIAVTGADAGNYTFNTTAAATADIAQRALTVTATGAAAVLQRQCAERDGFGRAGVLVRVTALQGALASMRTWLSTVM